jgi:ribosomal protein S18 acetylase RimI-like enzyme
MPECNFVIRNAADGDLPSIVDVFNRSLSVEHEITGQEQFQFQDDHVRSHLMPGAQTLVAVLAGEVVGFCIISDEVGENCTALWALYVDPRHFRKGIGNDLLAAAMKTASDRSLLVNCHRKNIPARRLYEKNGFVCGPYIEDDCLYGKEPLDQCGAEGEPDCKHLG